MSATLSRGDTVTLRQASREMAAKVVDIEWMVDTDGLYRQTVELLLFERPPYLARPSVALAVGDGLLPLVGWVAAAQSPAFMGLLRDPDVHRVWLSLCPCSWLPFEDLPLEDVAWLAAQQRMATCLGEHEPVA